MADNWEKWTFGDLDGVLSKLHDIADNKRTAFQARLKNLHRLNFPPNFKSTKGVASRYSAEQVVQMALAIEMAQLGLSPERTVLALSRSWFPVMMAMKLAAKAFCQHPEGFGWKEGEPYSGPASQFLYFDVKALQELTLGVDPKLAPDLDTMTYSFQYGGIEIVHHNLSLWTSYEAARVSLINVTGILFHLSKTYADISSRLEFFYEIIDWAESIDEGRLKIGAREYLFELFDDFVDNVSGEEQSDQETIWGIEDQLKIPPEWVDEALHDYRQQEARFQRNREERNDSNS